MVIPIVAIENWGLQSYLLQFPRKLFPQNVFMLPGLHPLLMTLGHILFGPHQSSFHILSRMFVTQHDPSLNLNQNCTLSFVPLSS